MSGKDIYILGAGFSAFAGIPLMNNFIQKARTYYFGSLVDSKKYTERKDIFDKVEQHIDRFSKVRAYLDIDLHNIEMLYSLIEMESQLGSIDKTAVSDFKHYVSYTIEHFTPS